MTRQSTNFDFIARPYRWLEYLSFGRSLERCRSHFLPALRGYRRVLALGDGDGRFTAQLLAANPDAHVEAVDSSAQMLKLLSGRVAALGPAAIARLKTAQTDILHVRPAGGPYDCVATHFFLDCLSPAEIASVLERLEPFLRPDAAWVVSEFALSARQPMRLLSKALIAGLYAAFALLTGLRTRKLPDYAPALQAAGFRLERQRPWLAGLLTSELWLRESGAAKQPPSLANTPIRGGA